MQALPPPHNGHDYSPKHSFRRRSKKTSKLRVCGLWVGNSPVTSEFPAQMASNVENASIWWRHHDSPSWANFGILIVVNILETYYHEASIKSLYKTPKHEWNSHYFMLLVNEYWSHLFFCPYVYQFVHLSRVHGFKNMILVCLRISISNLICKFPMPLSEKLLLFMIKNKILYFYDFVTNNTDLYQGYLGLHLYNSEQSDH